MLALKPTVCAILFLSASVGLLSQATAAEARPHFPNGILQSVENATFNTGSDHTTTLQRIDLHAPIKLTFTACQALGLHRENKQWWVLPINAIAEPADTRIEVNHGLWVLPSDASSTDHSWYIDPHNGTITATKTGTGLTVLLRSDTVTAYQSEPRPHSDPFRNRFSLQFPGSAPLEDALAAFYWGTMLPSVVEKTMAAHFPYSSGYVLSTLNVKSYAGSYPAVDHEFQIKGRLAIASQLDLDIVRRMIELQFKLMNDDPEHLYRSPCSVQPDGTREYHVRRNSQDNHQNAAMFPYTGNIEVIEEAWHLYEATKDVAWLSANITNLENAASWTAAGIDRYGRLWSDVYYEDQVIKDGRVTQAQAFAAYSFDLLSRMEKLLDRSAKATGYSQVSKRMVAALIAPLPNGYWDEKNQRFIDWIDRDGKVHDHTHLVANTAPVTFGYASPTQAEAVRHLIEQNDAEFERFPSFLSANIAQYTKAEIGSGGPYDLSAAGRYWYWDAAYRASQHRNAVLLQQLTAVAAEGKRSGYLMGERYDMDHVYYIDGKNAHGAERYYEYPNVFSAVTISKYLGITIPVDADLSVAPHLAGYGTIEFDQPAYAVRYAYNESGFTLKNLSGNPRKFKVDLSALDKAAARYRLKTADQSRIVVPQSSITLAAHEEAHWTPQE